jgi:hypothetical protein
MAASSWSSNDVVHFSSTCGSGFLFPVKFERTSAPFWPQTWQVNSGSMSDSRTPSGHLSPLIAVEWLRPPSA